jgi:PAS domain S-box-containing protein
MTNKSRSSYLIILAVFVIGVSVTIGLQTLLLNAKAKEERYDFESQVANLTLFVTDTLNKIENQFNLLITMTEVNEAFNNDNYMARFSQLSFEDRSTPLAFAIFRIDDDTGIYRLRHMSGKYATFKNKKEVGKDIENALFAIIYGELKQLNSRKTNNFFLDLKATGKISCLSREVFEQGNKRKMLISCFQLNEILDEVIGRSSYGWLEAFLYLGDKKSGYRMIYGYSSEDSSPLVDPSSSQSDKFIFLPWVISFADDDLSLLFYFQGHIKEGSKFKFIPSILGLFLTLSICAYLVSLKRRNSQISRKVEEKTKAYQALNLDLEKEIDKKESLFEQLNTSSKELKALTNSVNGVIWEADPNTMKYIYISDQVESILGYKSSEYMNGKLRLGGQKVPEGATEIAILMKNNFEGPNDFTIEYQGYRKDNELIWQRNIISKIFHNEKLVKVRGVIFDITQEKKREEQRVLMEGQLKHAQKMEAIGQLAAGIAHEINTPSQFVGDNLNFIADTTKEFTHYQKELESIILKLNRDELNQQLKQLKEQFDIEFLEEETPMAIEQSIDGVSRISKIVSAMKDFSHPGKDDKQKIDINRAIESTTIVARNEWKYIADLQFDFEDDLAQVNCFAGEINQVILNMIVNACHAIQDMTKGKEKGKILISTAQVNENIIIKISDNGAGMDEKTKQRIFDPFFTTKEVGQGTGQGLSLAYAVIVDQHGGDISVESTLGSGTTFIIQLPI